MISAKEENRGPVKTICFDAMNLALDRGTGVATYTRNLVLTAKAIGHSTGLLYGVRRAIPASPLEREVAFFDTPEAVRTSSVETVLRWAADVIADPFGLNASKIPLSGTVLTGQLGERWVPCDHVYAARRLFERAAVAFSLSGRFLNVRLPEPVDICHWTYPIPARVVGAKNIYTVHDLIPLRLPYTTLDWKPYYLRLMRKLAATADHIVTVSENSKRDIMSYLGVEASRVTNTYQAVSVPQDVLALDEEELSRRLVSLFSLQHRKYLLFYGSIEPKKNLARVIEAYLGADVKMPLVIVAAQSWQSQRELQLIEQEAVKRRRRIHLYQYLPWRMLATMIRGARAVLFPSIYEGFGLPVLEAMTLGTPVVTSNQSSIPEVAGDAALMVDPFDVTALRRAIVEVAQDDDTWAMLRERGLTRATEFSAAAYRHKVGELYGRFPKRSD